MPYNILSNDVTTAAANGDFEGVRAYLAKNPHLVNSPSIFQSKLLHIAAKAGYADIVKLLIESGADISALDYGKLTPRLPLYRDLVLQNEGCAPKAADSNHILFKISMLSSFWLANMQLIRGQVIRDTGHDGLLSSKLGFLSADFTSHSVSTKLLKNVVVVGRRGHAHAHGRRCYAFRRNDYPSPVGAHFSQLGQGV